MEELESPSQEINDTILQSISEDLVNAEVVKEGVPEEVGMLRIKSANKTLLEAKRRPDPQPLWLSLWYEGEICCMFADSNLGKSIYAVQIAESIAHTQRVLYFDFELSDKQFQLRYTDEHGETYHFPDNLFRGEINRESLNADHFEDGIIGNIEAAAIQSNAKVIIIDNLTWICSNSEKGDVAGQFMMKLTALKHKYDFSVLVIAHTPKRGRNNPITQNDLAGSKKLFNFFDSCFSIGKCAKDEGLHYVKQMKVRQGEYEYGPENVMVCQIEKNGAFLQFTPLYCATEKELLREQSENDQSDEALAVKDLKNQGYSIRQIARELNMSKTKVHRLIGKLTIPCPTVPSVPSVPPQGQSGQQDTRTSKELPS